MKRKLIVMTAILAIIGGCFVGCTRDKDDDMTTSKNAGTTDLSEAIDHGASEVKSDVDKGVTKVSEGMSKGASDVKEDLSEVMD